MTGYFFNLYFEHGFVPPTLDTWCAVCEWGSDSGFELPATHAVLMREHCCGCALIKTAIVGAKSMPRQCTKDSGGDFHCEHLRIQ